MRVDRLQRPGLTAALVDHECGNCVLATCSELLAVALDRPAGAVADIDDMSVRMDVDRTHHLLRPQVPRLLQRREHVGWRWIQIVATQVVHLQLILALHRDVHPRLRRMKVDMAWTEAISGTWRDRGN